MQKLYTSFFLMFVSPVLTLYAAFQSTNRTYKRYVLILFITVFGSVFSFTGEGADEIADGVRHLENVETHYSNISFVQFMDEMRDIIFLQENPNIKEDPYIHILSYVTGGILQLPGLFFVFVSFVYGYFFAGSMFRLFAIFPKINYSKLFFGFAIIFISLKNLEGINTVRTWTGLWVLFYACISYYQTGENKYLWLMFVPPLIHIGYGLMALPAWLVAFLGNRKSIYSILFAVSFATTLLNPGAAIDPLSTTEVGAGKVRAYQLEEQQTTDDTLQEYASNRFYVQYGRVGVQTWAIMFIAFILIGTGTYKTKMNMLESSLFSIGLLTKVLANSFWFLYAVANRADLVATVFILASLLLLWQRYFYTGEKPPFSGFQQALLSLALIALLPFLLLKTAQMIRFTSIFIFAFPFIPWFSEDFQISIREFLGYFL